MNRSERMILTAKENPAFGKGVGYKMCVIDELNDTELEKEAKTECFMLTVNTIGIDQRDVELAYILGRKKSIKQIEALKKSCDETQALLDKQIEATYKVVEKLNKAKDIISKFINAKSIEETCVAESKAEAFLKEE